MKKVILKNLAALEPEKFKQMEIVYPSENEQAFTGFVPALVNEIVTNVSVGMSLNDCADLLKMPRSTVAEWYNRNYCNFKFAVDNAQAKNKKLHVVKVQTGSKGSQWFLERRYKDDFSKEINVNVNHRIIDDVAKRTARVMMKYIREPEQLRLAAIELKQELNRIDI